MIGVNGDRGTQGCDRCEWGIEAHRGVMGVNGIEARGCDRCEWDRGTQGKNKISLGRVLSCCLHDSNVCDLWRQHYGTSNTDTVASHSLCLEGTMGPGLLGKGVEAGLGAVGRT